MDHGSEVRIARRLKALREERSMTQEALAERMGFNHRQTLASIEAGERRIQPEELVRAAEALGVELDDVTDPFRLVGEGRFSFRAEGVAPDLIESFQRKAGRWIATFRTLERQAGVPQSRIGTKLELDQASSFEDAQEAAEQIRQDWQLGDVPAETLREAIEREMEAHVLFVDAPAGLSGAAVQLPGLNTILVNRRENPGRRNFDLAHELFHLLTWDAMPPDRVEPLEVEAKKGNRVERLAENFAGALLMPDHTVEGHWRTRSDGQELEEWLNRTATALHVTSVALKWRLVVLGHLSRSEAEAVPDARLANNGCLTRHVPPLPFSHPFVSRVFYAVEAGWLSLRKASEILDMEVDRFAELCRAYGLELSYEL